MKKPKEEKKGISVSFQYLPVKVMHEFEFEKYQNSRYAELKAEVVARGRFLLRSKKEKFFVFNPGEELSKSSRANLMTQVRKEFKSFGLPLKLRWSKKKECFGVMKTGQVKNRAKGA